MTTNVAGHEGIGRVVKGLYFSLKLTHIFNSDMVHRTVGPHAPAVMMGKQVGVKYVETNNYKIPRLTDEL